MDNTITGNTNAEVLTPQEQINLLNQRLEQKTAEAVKSTTLVNEMLVQWQMTITQEIERYNDFAVQVGFKEIQLGMTMDWEAAHEAARDWASDSCYSYESEIEDCVDVELEHDGYGKEVTIRGEVSVTDHESLVREIVTDFLKAFKSKLEEEADNGEA